MSRAKDMTADISALLRARNALLWVVTREEARAEGGITDAGAAAGYDVLCWDCASGTSKLGRNGRYEAVDRNGDPQGVLGLIRESRQRQLWVLRDLPKWLGDPMVLRSLRNLARELPSFVKNEARAIVILSPSAEVPPELAGHAVVVEWPLPDREEIAAILDNVVESLPAEIARTITNGKREAAIDAAVGLTAEEAGSCYAKSLVTTKTIDAKAVSAEKKRVIARERVLEWFDADPRGLDAVGGLDNLKAWLTVRKTAFSQRAREFGLPSPKGLLMVGQSGCLHGDTPIHDPIDGSTLTVRERHERGVPFNVTAMTPNGPMPSAAMPPVIYPAAPMIRFTMSTGEQITVTDDHRFWEGGDSWVYASELLARLHGLPEFPQTTSCEVDGQLRESERVHLPTTSADVLQARSGDARRSSEIPAVSSADCRVSLLRDAQLLLDAAIGRDASRQQVDARACTPATSHSDDLDGGAGYSRLCQPLSRLSTQDFGLREKIVAQAGEHQNDLATHTPSMLMFRNAPQSRIEALPTGTSPLLQHRVLASRSTADFSDASEQLRDSYRRMTADDVVLEVRRESAQRGENLCVEQPPHHGVVVLSDTDEEVLASVSMSTAFAEQEYTLTVEVVKAERVPADVYYDFHVPVHENYAACGVYNHNCGKSLLCKAVTAAWGMPLLRLDLGALKSKYVGESEGNIRKALAVAETVSPCIVWLDEIEKALAGATQGAADGGVSGDALGTILNWMQERKGNVFVVATANDVSQLPPELLRKGRFDEIFFVDLPTVSERREILAATLKQVNRDGSMLDWAQLDTSTTDFTGAEVASLVGEALFTAFADGERALSTADLLAAASTVVPLAKTAAEKVAKLREWAKTRARPASKPTAVASPAGSGRVLDL